MFRYLLLIGMLTACANPKKDESCKDVAMGVLGSERHTCPRADHRILIIDHNDERGLVICSCPPYNKPEKMEQE